MNLFGKQHLETYSDTELINRYKLHGEMKSLGELYKRYTHLVMGICIYYLKDKNAAQDMVLQIFEKLVHELKLKEIENFKIWLSFVTRNSCISELRKIKVRQNQQEQYINEHIQETETASEETESENEQKIKNLKSALKSLNPFQKKCIELFYFEKMSYTQIAQITGYTGNEVKSYIQNGKRNLKLLMIDKKA